MHMALMLVRQDFEFYSFVLNVGICIVIPDKHCAWYNQYNYLHRTYLTISLCFEREKA